MEEKRSFIKVLGRFFSILFLIILIPYFVISCMLSYSAITNFDNIPEIFGYKPVIIKNNIMKNDLYKGDLLIIKTQETYSLQKKGDIITYKESTNHYKTRKINVVVKSPKVDENTSMENLDAAEYRLKASSKEKNDTGSIMSNQIEGVYFLRVPKIGTLLSYIENRWLLIGSLVVMILLIILCIKIAIKCAPKREKKAEEEKDLELMSAAELTTGVNLRDKLLKEAESKNKTNVNVQPQVQQPQQTPQPQVQAQQQPTGGDFGGGITIAPPTENAVPSQVQQPQQVPQQPVTPSPQIQVVPPTQVAVPSQPFAQQPQVQTQQPNIQSQQAPQPQAQPSPQVTVIPQQNKN